MLTMRKPLSQAAADVRRSYNVFVSSTYRDNVEKRKVVQDAITIAGMVWYGMEIFTVNTHSPPSRSACV
jgi:hypothetical protein